MLAVDPETCSATFGAFLVRGAGSRVSSSPIRQKMERVSGDVDFGDILRVLDAWGNKGGSEDLDGNGVVNFDDLLILLAAWGPCE